MSDPTGAALKAHNEFPFDPDAPKGWILEVEATMLDTNLIRVKYHGLPQDTGPELIMDPSMARKTINALKKCLPEYQHGDSDDKNNS